MASLSLTAPQISAEEEQRERDALSDEQRREIHNDLYGGPGSISGDEPIVEETDEIRQQGVTLIREAIQNMQISDKAEYLEALRRVPHLAATESNPLFYLRCEKYDAFAAAVRLTRYWKERKAIFGEQAFSPMSMLGAMRMEIGDIERGVHSVLPPDTKGRPVFYIDRSLVPRDRGKALRLFFYFLQCLSEQPAAHRHGSVFALNLQKFDPFLQLDRLYTKRVAYISQECFPFKLKAMHVVLPPPSRSLLFDSILPVIKFIVGRNLRFRTVHHQGSPIEVMDGMGKYGLTRESNHVSVGGSYSNEDFRDWMADQLEREAHRYRMFLQANAR